MGPKIDKKHVEIEADFLMIFFWILSRPGAAGRRKKPPGGP